MVKNLGKYITTLLNTAYFIDKIKDNELLIRKRFNRIRKKLSPYSLMYEKNIGELDDNFNLFEDNNRFLNFYSEYGIDLALKKYGIKRILKKRGFDKILYKINKDDYTHTLSIYSEEINSDYLISQLVLTLDTNICFSYKNCKSMTIEWLNLQDYRKVFTKERMKLPGQRFPGLGFGLLAFELIIQLARRLDVRYIVNTPDHFHNAYIYSYYFSFRNPKNKACIDILISDFNKLSLASLSWLIENEVIIEMNTKKVFKWEPDIMIMPVYRYKDFNNYFKTKKYQDEYKLFLLKNTYKIDTKKLYDNKDKFPKMIFNDIEDYKKREGLMFI